MHFMRVTNMKKACKLINSLIKEVDSFYQYESASNKVKLVMRERERGDK